MVLFWIAVATLAWCWLVQEDSSLAKQVWLTTYWAGWIIWMTVFYTVKIFWLSFWLVAVPTLRVTKSVLLKRPMNVAPRPE